MRQCITTTYLPPTDTKGPRIRARAAAGSLTLPWDHDLTAEGNHIAAAHALREKLQWEPVGELASGFDYNERGQHVFVEDK